MDREERIRRIQEYVRERLRAEVLSMGRGGATRVAEAIGVAAPHLSNVIAPVPSRNPGEDMRAALAERWGMTLAELEAVATGEPAPAAYVRRPAPDPRIDRWIAAGRLPEWVASAAGHSAGGFAAYSDEDLWSYCTNLVRAAERPPMPPLDVDDPRPRKRKR